MAFKITDECISCGACAAECPVNAISEGDGKYVIDADTCISCGACAGTCPVGAPVEEEFLGRFGKIPCPASGKAGDFSMQVQERCKRFVYICCEGLTLPGSVCYTRICRFGADFVGGRKTSSCVRAIASARRQNPRNHSPALPRRKRERQASAYLRRILRL